MSRRGFFPGGRPPGDPPARGGCPSSRSPLALTCLPPEMTDGHSVGYPTGYGRRASGRSDQDQYAERPGSPARPPPRGQAPENRRRPEKSTVTRTKPAEQRRAELLEAARALFLAKGVAATSLDDITQRAGVSKGLFYLYFASKEDLVLALQEQFSHEIAARMRTAVEAEADW